MGRKNRRRSKNISMRVKSGNKKSIHNKKILHSKVDAEYKNINSKITRAAESLRQEKPKLEIEEEMTFDQVKKLLTKNDVQRPRLRLSLDDKLYLEPLLRKYGSDFGAMAADVKLNKMQWNHNQIRKRHEQYLKLQAEGDAGKAS